MKNDEKEQMLRDELAEFVRFLRNNDVWKEVSSDYRLGSLVGFAIKAGGADEKTQGQLVRIAYLGASFDLDGYYKNFIKEKIAEKVL